MAGPMFRIIASTRTTTPQPCQSCSAPITWARTYPNDKPMPLNGEPVALKTETDLILGTIEYIASSDSHFATCPDSQKWSRPKRC